SCAQLGGEFDVGYIKFVQTLGLRFGQSAEQILHECLIVNCPAVHLWSFWPYLRRCFPTLLDNIRKAFHFARQFSTQASSLSRNLQARMLKALRVIPRLSASARRLSILTRSFPT